MCDVLDAYFLQLNLFLKMRNKRNKIKPFSIRVFIQKENHLMFLKDSSFTRFFFAIDILKLQSVLVFMPKTTYNGQIVILKYHLVR